MSKYIKLLSGLIISGLFFWLAFRKSDFGQIVSILRQTRWEYVLVAFALGVFALFSRSYRWKLLGKEYKNVSYWCFFKATCMGLSLNTFLPFRSGDVFQGYFIARSSNLPKSYALSTIFLERMMDCIPPALMLSIGSLFVVLPSQIKLSRLGMLFGGAGALIIGLIVFRKAAVSFMNRFIHARHGQRVMKLLDTIVVAVTFLKDRQVLLKAFPITLFNWLVINNVAMYCLLHALDIPITFTQTFMVQAITVMSVAIPSSPGFVGTWEFFCVLALSLFSIDRDRALSFAVLSHFMAFLPLLIFGLYFLMQEYLLKHFRAIPEEK